jgi:ELWxxDGT repeat protein
VLYFAAKDAGHGTELWSSDGTSDGTTLVKDIWPGPSGSSPQSLFVVEGVLFFTASDGTSGQELWRSDGTAEGTVLVQDIAPGVASSSPRRIAAAGGRLFFYADDGASGAEPWSGRLSLLAGRPRQAIEELRDEVLAEALPPGIATSLLAKLDRALRALGGHDSPAALRALGALRSQLQALAGNQVPAGTAEEWAGFVRSIAELLESGEGGAEPADYMQDWGSELTRSRPPWPAPSVPIPQVASMPWIR